MATYLIMFDLNKEAAGYPTANQKLSDRIRELFATRWHHLDSTWIVVTEMTAVQIRDDLKNYIDSNDEILVVKSASVAAWAGFDKNGSDWLKTYI